MTTQNNVATIQINGHPVFTLRTDDPLMHWMKVAEDWPTLPEHQQAQLRPVVAKAVLHLFKKKADDFEPLSCWHEEDLYERGAEAMGRLIGGTCSPRAALPYMAVLKAIGVPDEKAEALLLPHMIQNARAAYGSSVVDETWEAEIRIKH